MGRGFSTNPEDLIEAYNKAKTMGQYFIVFSTYHSCHKLAKINFNTAISDESQYLVQEDFFDNYKNVKAKNNFFFTATEKIY